MKNIPDTIALRPRFQLDLIETNEHILAAFEKTATSPFIVKRMDDHVFIKFNQEANHFWSPQLHLEIVNDETTQKSKIYGLFGPNPTLWTFFMFLHFGVATIFIVLGIWTYSSIALGKPYGIQLGLMLFMVLLWFGLYAFGRAGRSKGKPQMHELHEFMMKIVSSAEFKV
ncbi:MAG: GTP-binding protein [Cellulophaga sp.]|nr:GTP-binding protein [Cellulophaga sp.]